MYDVELSFTKQTDGTAAQAVTVTAASTNVLNLGSAGNFFRPAYLHLRVTETFTAAGAATLTAALQSDSASTFGSAATLETLFTTAALATLVDGYHFVVPLHLQGMEQFLRLYFTVATGPMTAGKIVAYINDSPEL
jgi:superoxide dismutase